MDTDLIVYLITDHGIDGRAKENIIFASYNATERDEVYEASKNKAWYSKEKRIVTLEHEITQALAKLNGVNRLVLDIEQREVK